jgi:hypothetical protein
MKKRYIAWIAVLAIACFSYKTDPQKLELFYTKNYPGDTWSNHRTALLWTLSYLGAELPKNSLNQAIAWKDSLSFSLNFEKLGFNPRALEALKTITDSLKQTAGYKKYGKIDLGHFIALTIGSSWHYYSITGVPKTLDEAYRLRNFKHYKTFAVTKSVVAKHHRLLKYASGSDKPADWLFVAEEGEGNLTDGTFATSVFEVFDIMPNGQLRFAIYNRAGELTAASPKHLGESGKPAKCLWCHEVLIQPLLTATDTVPNFISPAQFQQDVVRDMSALARFRASLSSDLDFKLMQDHTQMEIAYISYMQPSVSRLAQEWHMGDKEVEAIIGSVTRQQHHEFKFLGELVFRRDLNYAEAALLPSDIREPSQVEPNYLQHLK